MLFNNVIGQQETKQQLLQLVQQNRLSHALLFLGKEGSGALPLALAFANYVCLSSYPGAHISAAGSLFGETDTDQSLPVIENDQQADAWMQKHPAWTKAEGYVHPDIHFSYPVVPRKPGDKPLSTDYITEWRAFIKEGPYRNGYEWLQFINAENKQGNITVYECNDIIRKLSLKSFESRYKILIMWLPEYLGNAGNKLLKLIEEPPPDTLFLLVAENEHMVLPTILSRTQLVKVPRLSIEDIETAIIAKGDLTPEQARQVALMSEGNYLEALKLLQNPDDDWQGLLREWLNLIVKGSLSKQVKWIEGISMQGREKQKQFLQYFNHLLQQAIRLQIMPGASGQLPDTERDFALRVNKIASLHQQQQIVEELDKAMYYIERNANAKILFHALTIKLYHIIAKSEVVEMK